MTAALSDPAVVLAYGTAATGVVGSIAALVDRVRAPGRAALLERIQAVERRLTGVVRWYHDQQVAAAAAGYVLPPIDPSLLR